MPSAAPAIKPLCPYDGVPLNAIPDSHLRWCGKCRGIWVGRRGIYNHFGYSIKPLSRDASAASGKRCPVDGMPLLLVDQDKQPGALVCAHCRGVWVGLQKLPVPVAALSAAMRRRLARQRKDGTKPAVSQRPQPAPAAEPAQRRVQAAATQARHAKPQVYPHVERQRHRPKPPRPAPAPQQVPPDLDAAAKQLEEKLRQAIRRLPAGAAQWRLPRLARGHGLIAAVFAIWLAIAIFGLAKVLIFGGIAAYAVMRVRGLRKQDEQRYERG